MSDAQTKAEKHFGNRKFFIVEKYVGYQTERYNIHNQKMYDITTATRKLLALDTLNEDRERTSYHLQEVDTSMVTLVLTKDMEVKEEQSEMPF